MTETVVVALTVATALGCGLVAGIFFAFSTFVMGALGRLRPEQGIAAMQSVNVVVLNPWFFGAFFGTALGCLAVLTAGLAAWDAPDAAFLVAGSALYLTGCIGVTVAFNVPLNRALAAVEPASPDGAVLWARYLSTWTAWNHVRTAAAFSASACFIVAIP